ncbi:DUF1279 domain containing protein [Nitzschia inconspicua]|uniref:DUF1279 domain containing protein n=1 Tax=Nitzschia inconspicua TaxID=303405 RepID=A0A9K3LEL1_9STRA|nr:DUF1279 domain containing protein [Nitzschia inconspicua]KAG7359431.1 DUF1279 domain containing protein [Nitzschia inconspicua]
MIAGLSSAISRRTASRPFPPKIVMMKKLFHGRPSSVVVTHSQKVLPDVVASKITASATPHRFYHSSASQSQLPWIHTFNNNIIVGISSIDNNREQQKKNDHIRSLSFVKLLPGDESQNLVLFTSLTPSHHRMFSTTTTTSNKDDKEPMKTNDVNPTGDSGTTNTPAATDTTTATTSTVQAEKPSFRTMVRKYGPLFITTYLTVYVSTVFGFYMGITSGLLDPAYLLSFISSGTNPDSPETAVSSAELIKQILNRYSWTQWAVPTVEKNPWAANLAVAWIVTKPTEPIRFGVTVGIVPLLARTLGYNNNNNKDTTQSTKQEG